MKYVNIALLVTLISVSAYGYVPYLHWEPPMTGASSSIAVTDDARGVPLNPALLGERDSFSMYFSHYIQTDIGPKSWNLYFDTPIGGIGYDSIDKKFPDPQNGTETYIKASRFSYSVGHSSPGSGWLSAGCGLDIYSASKPYLTKATGFNTGLVIRPIQYFSIGITARDINQPRFLRQTLTRNYGIGIGLRPFTNRITLSGDFYWDESDTDFEDPGYRVGLDFEPLKGVIFSADYRNSLLSESPEERIAAGITVDFSYGTIGYNARLNADGEYEDDSAFIGVHSAYRPSILSGIGKNFAKIEMSGDIGEEESGWSLLGSHSYSGRDIIEELKKAANDSDIEGVVIELGGLSSGFSPGIKGIHQEIRNEIKKVQAKGKPVYCFLYNADTTAAYYIASACDKVMMPRWGHFSGLGTEMSMWRITKLTERYGINWDYVTAGDNKGTFHSIGDAPNDEDYSIVKNLVDENYYVFVRDVCKDRNLSEDEFRKIVDGPPMYATSAKNLGLIDEVGRYEDFKGMINRSQNREEDDTLYAVDLSHRTYYDNKWGGSKSVRVIMATGGINVGESGHNFITGGSSMGADTIVRRLKEARNDPSVAAVILRVDSGGGSAMASEDIFEEVQKTLETKPVIASMGSTAASGGYMISIGTQRIFADETTITGSIGVVWGKPVFEEFYDKYGLERYPVKSGEHTDANSIHRHFTDEEREWAEAMIEEGYELFKSKVAEMRNLDKSVVDDIANGRIYTGTEAKRLGLIDEIGGLEEALIYTKSEAGLKNDAPVEFVGSYSNFWSQTAGGIAASLGLKNGLF